MAKSLRFQHAPPPMSTTRRSALAAGCCVALSTPRSFAARTVDLRRPVRVVVPFPAGGTTDRLVRAITSLVAAGSGQAFVVDNRPGGSTLIAAQALSQARPDGHTIGVVPLLLNRLKALGRTDLDLTRDFSFIARAAVQTHGLVAQADSRLRTLDSVVASARVNPGGLTYATSGVASLTHGAMEDFCARTGIEMRHIPFKGGVESMTALRAGIVDLIAESPVWATEVDAGRVRLLATWNRRRLARYPEVPTMRELGHPLTLDAAIGFGAPPSVARPALERLRREFRQAILSPEFADECSALLASVAYLEGNAFRAYAQENAAHELELVRRLGSRLAG